jgi:hypothetical protein
MVRMQRDQLRRSVGEVASRIMLEMPFGRDDITHKCIERPIVRDQAPIQDPGIPVVQYATDVEDDGGRPIDSGRGQVVRHDRLDQPQG